MNNLISAQEAFNAMIAGKNIMCRAAGEMLNFDDLDQFPATVFTNPKYEFCIKVEMINIAGIEFTKPLTLDEYQEGQEVFIINSYDPSIYVVNFKTNALIESINRGFVQRDVENAKLQLKALSKILGCELDSDLSIVRLGEEPKKTTSNRKAKSISESRESKLAIVEQGSINVIEDAMTSESDIGKISGDQYQELLNDLINRVNNAKTPAEANALVRYTRAWTEEQRKPLMQTINARLIKLSSKNKPINVEPPSLMVQIQNALDLTALDTLEIDVASRHPDIQPKLMACVLKRRKELEVVS